MKRMMTLGFCTFSLFIFALSMNPGLSWAQDGSGKVEDKVSAEFEPFLGAKSDTTVNGLRNGTSFDLVTTPPSGAPVTTTITPPTGKMGYGEVSIALALTQKQLSGLGITSPTDEQLKAALTGGTFTTGPGTTCASSCTLTGILALRNEGHGWGWIAKNELGMSLGEIMKGLKSADAAAASGATSTTATSHEGSPGQGGLHRLGNDRPDRPDRPVRPEHSDRPERPHGRR